MITITEDQIFIYFTVSNLVYIVWLYCWWHVEVVSMCQAIMQRKIFVIYAHELVPYINSSHLSKLVRILFFFIMARSKQSSKGKSSFSKSKASASKVSHVPAKGSPTKPNKKLTQKNHLNVMKTYWKKKRDLNWLKEQLLRIQKNKISL